MNKKINNCYEAKKPLDTFVKLVSVKIAMEDGQFFSKFGFLCPGVNKETLSIKRLSNTDIKTQGKLLTIDASFRDKMYCYEIGFVNSFTNKKQTEIILLDKKVESVTVKDGVLYFTYKLEETDEVKIL